MAMIVKNNMGAKRTLNTLNKNSEKLEKALSKVSSGMKIVGAKDDSAQFAISEKMREQIRSLDQDSQNVQNGQSLFKVAEGGIENIVEELRTLKELAIKSANDTNNDGDRLTIQKEFDQRIATINDIATETEYNTKKLLDGQHIYREGRYETIRRFVGREWVPPIYDNKFEYPTPPYNSIYRAVSEETDTDATVTISGTDYTISNDGIYRISAGFTGTITVDAQNVKIKGSGINLTDVSIVGPAGGNANLWIENLNITNTQAQNIIKFQGSNNVLTIRGSNTLSNFESSADHAVINIGEGLNVQGNASATMYINNSDGGFGSGIGTDARQSSTGNVGIVNANVNLAMYDGSGIGSGADRGSIGKVIVENSTVNFTGHYFSGIGSGKGGSSCGDIWVVGSNVRDNYSVDTCIGSGYRNSSCGNIYVLDSNVYANNSDSPCIGAGDAGSTCENILISNSVIDSKSIHGAGVGSGRSSTVNGTITITNKTSIRHQSPEGAAIGTGENGKVMGSIYISKSSLDRLDASEAYSDGTHKYKGIGKGKGGTAKNVNVKIPIKRDGYWVDVYEEIIIGFDEDTMNPLKIHHGTQANQAINFYLEDMHTKSLGTENLLTGGLPTNEEDLARYDALSYDKDLQKEFLTLLSNASYRTLDDINVTTKFDANLSIRVIDGAIDYALDQATNIGSYLQRLDYTGINITTMNENVQGAESTIRDADMAKEMTEYTKFNVLLQASQSMLAQANQNASSVLSLLQ